MLQIIIMILSFNERGVVMNFIEKLDKADLEIAKALKEVEVIGRSFCCTSCTLAEIESDYFIAWKIFETGMNENIDYYLEDNGKIKILFGVWNLTSEQLDLVIQILSKYFDVERPIDDTKCILIKSI